MTRVPKPADHVQIWQPSPEAELADLRFLWPRYRINLDNGVWSARYVKEGGARQPVMTAESAYFLRMMIIADNRERQYGQPGARC